MHGPAPLRDDAPTLDLVATLVAAAQFAVLCNAMRAAGIAHAYRAGGLFTVFAPTDAAFRKVTRETINTLLKDKARMASILSFHVLPGKIMARDLMTGEYRSVTGKTLCVDVGGEAMRVGDARIVKTDIEASNGVIHAIDTVLMPA